MILSALALFAGILWLPETLPEQQPERIEENGGAGNSDTNVTITADESPIENTAAPSESCNPSMASSSLLLRPLLEMTILARDKTLILISSASFLQAVVYNTDASLVLFYIEEHLNVREDDIATMFLYMGLLGVLLQGIGLQPLVYALGEKGLLWVSFVSGSIHNLLYGIATNKFQITVALSLSQVTKLSYPLLSSLASQQVGNDEQGRVQGALLGLNALAGALGPVSMNWIYIRTKDGRFGPGTMFVLASSLCVVGTMVVGRISPSRKSATTMGSNNSNGSGSTAPAASPGNERRSPSNDNNNETWQGGDMEEPLLLQLGESSTI